jgi:hypothetical protein
MAKTLMIGVDEGAGEDPDAGYRAMAADAEREAEALAWSEGLIGDAASA